MIFVTNIFHFHDCLFPVETVLALFASFPQKPKILRKTVAAGLFEGFHLVLAVSVAVLVNLVWFQSFAINNKKLSKYMTQIQER